MIKHTVSACLFVSLFANSALADSLQDLSKLAHSAPKRVLVEGKRAQKPSNKNTCEIGFIDGPRTVRVYRACPSALFASN